MSKPDPFAGQLSLPPEFLPTYAEPYEPAPKRKRRQQFALFPMWWCDKLRDADADKHTWFLAIHILHRYWKNKSKPFKLANMLLADAGMDKSVKSRSLAILERLGLVRVERRIGKSSFVEPVLEFPGLTVAAGSTV